MARPERLVLTLILVAACANPSPPDGASGRIGRFDPSADLLLTQFDSKTDVDDLHSVAATATLLADPRFADVRHHAVAGAYGVQEGLYVPAEELFDAAFGARWSDAHADRERALDEVSDLAAGTLRDGGDVWIAEAGQSDFSAALIQRLQAALSDVETSRRVHVVQHSDWNEEVTSVDALAFVRAHAMYHRIPDGNAEGNGTPGFRQDAPVAWRGYVAGTPLADVWERAIATADRYNGAEGRYLNASIAAGGLDFSDVSETCWIFGFEELPDATAFFETFTAR